MLCSRLNCPIAGIVLSLVALYSRCEAQQCTITVNAGNFDRSEAIVTFHFPKEMDQGVYRMASETSGNPVNVQVDANNRGRFILDELSAGASRTYLLSAEPVTVKPAVTTEIDHNTILFRSEDREVLSYFHGNNDPSEVGERYRRGGYIHPVYTPDGVTLTNHLNPERHAYHYGIWSAWSKTEFQGRNPDFWGQDTRYPVEIGQTGRVDQIDSLDTAWEGSLHGGFRARHHFVDLLSSAPLIALNEQWEVTVYRSAPGATYQIFDLVATQTVNTAQPLHLLENNWGGVGFRGHIDWEDPDNVFFLTSEGLERDGNFTRARWCHIGGYIDGQLAGIAILGHPKNFRHPQPMRIHPEEPFFNFAPTQLGDFSIKPGSPYVAQYRYVTYDGEPDPAELDRLWNDYAYPPGVTVTTQ